LNEKGWLWRWGPALLIMGVMFAVSAQPKAAVPDFGAWDWDVKKTAHLLGYALLGLAYLRGLENRQPPTARHAALAVVLAALYAATDEYHQSFVPGRGADVLDVGIDTLGATLGVGARWLWRLYRARRSVTT
jgi:VanZ family protein